jgi:D-sedoheptulose 7-phosphate isomerase
VTSGDREPTGFLYPFIDAQEHDTDALLADLARSARAKTAESEALQAATLAACAGTIEAAGTAMAARVRRGGRLFTFGNGGSATDADAASVRFQHPDRGHAVPARSLVADSSVLTALANDVGFELVFSRQLIAHARADDIALGFSTSGGSQNVLRAFAEARARGLLTVGMCGYDGGAMATSGDVEHCLIVSSDSVHRVQETQQALLHALWSAVQRALERTVAS